MATTTNIQMATNPATQEAGNKNEETTKMTIINNIQGIIRNNTKAMAGLFIGGMMAVSLMLPGSTSADELARPASDTPAASSITSIGLEFPSVDDYDSLVPSIKSVTNLEFPSVDDYDSLVPSIKTVTNLEFPSVDGYDSLVPSIKTVTNLEFPSVDDYDSLIKTITTLSFPSQDDTV
jgi:hypothetical protein